VLPTHVFAAQLQSGVSLPGHSVPQILSVQGGSLRHRLFAQLQSTPQHFVPGHVPPQPSEQVLPMHVSAAQSQFRVFVPGHVPPQPSEQGGCPSHTAAAQAQLGDFCPGHVSPQPSGQLRPTHVVCAQLQFGTFVPLHGVLQTGSVQFFPKHVSAAHLQSGTQGHAPQSSGQLAHVSP
jgi:hypothetical protein